jgi:hypothetical protein
METFRKGHFEVHGIVYRARDSTPNELGPAAWPIGSKIPSNSRDSCALSDIKLNSAPSDLHRPSRFHITCRMANPFLSEGFTRHTRRVFTRTSVLPDTSSLTVQARRPLPPSTIIICTWMSANPHHIQNYISNYSKLFLSSHILLILAPKSPMIFSSPVSQQRQLLSGVQFLLADERKKFLVHIFSGGGAASLCNLAIAYRKLIFFGYNIIPFEPH